MLPVLLLLLGTDPDAVSAGRAVVARYEELVVLGTADDAALERLGTSRAAVDVLGKILYGDQREALSAIEARLISHPAEMGPFLDWLERDADLFDADKLALRDLVESLAAAPPAKEHTSRLAADVAVLQQIRDMYDREIGEALGRFTTRGMVRKRERWDVFLARARQRHPLEALVAAHQDILRIALPAERGKRKLDPFSEFGARLPSKTVALTFDDGPDKRYTPAILKILEEAGIKAAFFEVGQRARDADASLVARVARDHLLANHSMTHKLMPKLNDEAQKAQVDDSRKAIEAVAGIQVSLFRPPYGAFDARLEALLRERGTEPYLWNVDTRDWADPVPRSIADTALAQIDKWGRGVILMHDVHPQSVEALPLVIKGLRERGYRFVLWDGKQVVGGETRGAGPVVATEKKSMYGKSWAVVIGINNYQKWPKLSYAVNDARAVRDLLVGSLGFEPERVTMLLDGDATRQAILAALGDALADPDVVSAEDRLFVFYAGHGVTRKLPGGGNLGYIVPVNADTKAFASQAISMRTFQDIDEIVPAKHILYLMDACYSGVGLTRAGGTPGGGRRYVEEVTGRRARQMLTAGGAEEQVADGGPGGHSIFTWTVLNGLEGRADMNGDGYVTATELSAYVSPSVSALSRQTPAFGSLVGSAGGEFVFELRHTEEMLSDTSEKLDQRSLALHEQLERIQEELAEERARAAALRSRLGEPADIAAEVRRLNDEGVRLFKEQKHAKALSAFLEASRLDPQDVQSVNNLGFVYHKLGDGEAAIEWLKKAIALDPARAVAHLNLGEVYESLKEPAAAAAAYERYVALTKPTPFTRELRRKIAKLKVSK